MKTMSEIKKQDLRGVKCRVDGSPLLLVEATVRNEFINSKGFEYGALLVRSDRTSGPFLFYLDLMEKKRLRDLRKAHNLVCVQTLDEGGAIYDTPDRAFQKYCKKLGLKASDGIKTSRM